MDNDLGKGMICTGKDMSKSLGNNWFAPGLD